jgi:hypothetical protein
MDLRHILVVIAFGTVLIGIGVMTYMALKSMDYEEERHLRKKAKKKAKKEEKRFRKLAANPQT